MVKVVAIVSGGMDSVTLAHELRSIDYEVHGVSFNYGQRHKKELDFAEMLVGDSILESWHLVDVSNIQELLGGSSLTDRAIDVPDGLYDHESMKMTVVPNRNMIMLSIASGYAVALGAKAVFTGVHAGDHAVYPDCRPEFIEAVDSAVLVGNEGFGAFGLQAVRAPYVHIGKHDICRIGDRLGVDWLKTWSCYKGGEVHCGRCGTCTERKEAFALANVPDPTEYLDPNFERVAYRG